MLFVYGVDHLDVDLRAFEGGDVGLVKAFYVVEEVAGEGGVGVDGGALEAEVLVVVDALFVDGGGVVDGDGYAWDGGGRGAAEGEHAAVDVFEVGGGELVVVGGDELYADVFE